MPEFLKKFFNREAPLLTPAEEFLLAQGVKYKKQPDGTLLVRKDIDLSFQRLDALPDLSSVAVEGDFRCRYNNLVSLEGAPRRITGALRCEHNPLSYVGPNIFSFNAIATDHGSYKNWQEIPAWLRADDAGKRALVDATPVTDQAQLDEYLKWALHTDKAALAEICIGKGADVNCNGGEPLMIAARREKLELAKLLCLAGAQAERAIGTARKKWRATVDCDAGALLIIDGETHDFYRPIDMWLTENAGALREAVLHQQLSELRQANESLQQRLAGLQAAAEAAGKPVELDKPKRKPQAPSA